MDIFNPYYLQIVMFMIINAIMGISIYITLASGQLSLGAAGFMSVGAYVAALLTLKLSLPIIPAIRRMVVLPNHIRQFIMAIRPLALPACDKNL